MMVVSVQKAIDLNGSGETIQDAVPKPSTGRGCPWRASPPSRCNGSPVWSDESSTTYQVELKVWFTLLERMHG